MPLPACPAHSQSSICLAPPAPLSRLPCSAVLEKGGKIAADMFVCAAGCHYNLNPSWLAELGVGEPAATACDLQHALPSSPSPCPGTAPGTMSQHALLAAFSAHSIPLLPLNLHCPPCPAPCPAALHRHACTDSPQALATCTTIASWEATRASAPPPTLSLVGALCMPAAWRLPGACLAPAWLLHVSAAGSPLRP